jgi:hypothetical protein
MDWREWWALLLAAASPVVVWAGRPAKAAEICEKFIRIGPEVTEFG